MIVVQLTASRSLGSVERQILGLSERLPSEYTTVAVSFPEGGRSVDFIDQAQAQGLHAVTLPEDTPHCLAATRHLVRLLQRLKAELLCCRGYKSTLLGRIAARRAGIPIIAVSHGWTAETLKVRLYEKAERYGLRFVDRVVAISQAQAEKVANAGIDPERIIVIPDAVRPERFAHPRICYRSILEKMFARPPAQIVGAAGRLSPEKGFDVLIDAARIMRQRHPDVGFVVFGDGPMRKTLQAQVMKQGLKDTIILAGYRADFDNFLPHFDLFALASFTEGLPNVVLEAFAAGIPVVATSVGGTPELVRDRINGLLVPPRDSAALAHAMAHLIDSKSDRQRMGTCGQQLVRDKFTFEAQARAYERLFRTLIRRPPASQAAERQESDSAATCNGVAVSANS